MAEEKINYESLYDLSIEEKFARLSEIMGGKDLDIHIRLTAPYWKFVNVSVAEAQSEQEVKREIEAKPAVKVDLANLEVYEYKPLHGHYIM